jgi:hypothetical protein
LRSLVLCAAALILSASCSQGVTMIVSDYCERYDYKRLAPVTRDLLLHHALPGIEEDVARLARNQKDYRCNCPGVDDKDDCD